MNTRSLALLLIGVLVAGCNRGVDRAGAPLAPALPQVPGNLAMPATPASVERTWVGLLPCSDCQGIDTRLVLRLDGNRRNYLMTETFVGGTQAGKRSFNRAGSWAELTALMDGEPVVQYILDPGKSGQRYLVQPDGALELVDEQGHPLAEAVAYRLQRL